jgi:hypothetical protein
LDKGYINDFASISRAIIRALNGTTAGKQLTVTKELATLGYPFLQVAAVVRGTPGYYLLHIEGENYPVVNDISIGPSAYLMKDGDVSNRMEYG